MYLSFFYERTTFLNRGGEIHTIQKTSSLVSKNEAVLYVGFALLNLRCTSNLRNDF